MDVQLVYATFPDRDSAETLGRRMLEERLAACVTYWDAGTQYWWEGEIEQAAEALALFKTAPDQRAELVARLEEEHPYDTPCVVGIDSQGGCEGYAAWVHEETGEAPRTP